MDHNCNEFFSLFVVTLSSQILKNNLNLDLGWSVYCYCKFFGGDNFVDDKNEFYGRQLVTRW